MAHAALIHQSALPPRVRHQGACARHRRRFAATWHSYIAGAIKAAGGRAPAIGGTADHVHIVAELGRDRSLADSARDIKANSSRWVHTTYRDKPDFAWQDGYGAASAGRAVTSYKVRAVCVARSAGCAVCRSAVPRAHTRGYHLSPLAGLGDGVCRPLRGLRYRHRCPVPRA